MAANVNQTVIVTGYNNLVFKIWQISQNAVANTTTVGWSMELTSASNGRIISNALKAWKVVINGLTYSGSNFIDIGNNATKTLASGQETISHNSDGNKTFSYSFSQEFNITFAGVQVGTKSGSGQVQLETLHKAATFTTRESAVIGEPIKLTFSNLSSRDIYSYTLSYSFEGKYEQSVALNPVAGNSYTFTLPLSVADYIPNALSGELTISCTTYKEGAYLGSITKRITATVPEYWPSIDLVTFVEANASVAASGVGGFVQNVSKLKVNITASGVYGSTIKSIKSEFQGKTYTGAEWTSQTIVLHGEHSIQVTITDSRGRTQSGPKKLTVIPYELPWIESFQASRVDTSGNFDDDGTRVRAPIKYGFDSLSGKNKVDLKIEYKRSIDTSYSTLWSVTGHTSGSTTALPTANISTDYQYDLRLTLTDIVGSKVTYGATVPSGAVILDLKADGKGIAFFKTSTKDGVEIPGELPGSPIELTLEASANDLTTPGYYVAVSAAIAKTVAKLPIDEVNEPFSIEVRRVGATGNLKQTLHAPSIGIWERTTDSQGAWNGDWYCLFAGPGRLLWSGSSLMNSTSPINLAKPIRRQANGIVLVFSRYADGAAQNYLFSCHYVPKQLIFINNGQAEYATVFNMSTTLFDYLSNKYLYIADTYIRGHADNSASGTKNGITFNNGQFALKYVIGV